ncbi:hypothetical protein K461DRAFT_294859 [Myriangium duriaei CBS 260.36]|uniref:Histone deacetylase complex subunit SAP30 Sin3 binding domain-containing protein n=1 Tax=Myriangium duriaei CBS 260.36 TaxID=1168546 RepID=A0A9P4J0B7_9PEZI|nr:hypothetical protein K461DRAFT_294859 [Myriangium duriaei CBS 260.36]
MAPPKKPTQDDSSSSSRTPGEKSAKANGKKAVTSHPNGATSILRDIANAEHDNAAGQSSAENKGLSWSHEPLENLQAYKFAHRLPVPSPWTHPYRQAVLTSGFGQTSPSSVGKRRLRAQREQKKSIVGPSSSSSSRQDLGNAVRKHFNAAPADESAIIAAMVYKVHNQDKAFRLRSRPEKSKTSAT